MTAKRSVYHLILLPSFLEIIPFFLNCFSLLPCNSETACGFRMPWALLIACSGFRQWGLQKQGLSHSHSKGPPCPVFLQSDNHVSCSKSGESNKKVNSSGMHNVSFSHVLSFQQHSLNEFTVCRVNTQTSDDDLWATYTIIFRYPTLLSESPDIVHCPCKGWVSQHRVPRCLETGRGAYLSPTTVWSTCPPDFTIHLHASGRVIWNNPHLIKKHSSEILKLVNVKVPSFLQQPSKINYWHLPCSWSFTEKSPSCQFISAKPLFKIQWII